MIFTLLFCIYVLYSFILPLLFASGGFPGREEGDSAAVQAEGQVLPGGCDRGADPGGHPQAFLPAGQGGHSVRGDLLPPGDRCASGLVRCPGQVRRVQQVAAPSGLPLQ